MFDVYHEWHGWSNLACVHRSSNSLLAQKMEDLFVATLRAGEQPILAKELTYNYFEDLSDARRTQLEALGFTEDIWDEDKLPPGLTKRNWSSFTEEDREVITALGYDAASWQSLS